MIVLLGNLLVTVAGKHRNGMRLSVDLRLASLILVALLLRRVERERSSIKSIENIAQATPLSYYCAGLL